MCMHCSKRSARTEGVDRQGASAFLWGHSHQVFHCVAAVMLEGVTRMQNMQTDDLQAQEQGQNGPVLSVYDKMH